MEILHNLYMRIPLKYRRQIVPCIISFLVGQIVIWIWGLEALLSILICFIFIAALFRAFGLSQAIKVERRLIGLLFGRFRGMIIFAFIPVVWEFIRNPSITSIIGLLVILLCVTVIWDKFGKIIDNWGGKRSSSRRKGRR